MNTVQITINGKPVTVPAGINLIEAAKVAGIPVAHFCYHPALSVAGQCRMCMCEIEKNPKLQIACNTTVQEGMAVQFESEKIEEAVRRNLEFHLVNHPIDCPICDQAGECILQDYYLAYGRHKSQVPLETKVHKRKSVDLGPKIILDQERCVLCGRCVRFTAEISKTNELGYFNRGDRAVISTVNDRPLTGNYQENLADICPVGALTSKDFRFECRVWYLSDFKTICMGCSAGCNIRAYHRKQKRFFRLKPEFNPEVNGHWMCDEGRTTYKLYNYDRRLATPRVDETPVDWNEAFSECAPAKSGAFDPNSTAIWLSPQLTNEEIVVTLQWFNKSLGAFRFFSEETETLVEKDGPADQLLFRKDRNPNSSGFLKLTKALKINVQKTEFLIPLLAKTIKTLVLIAPDYELGCPSFAKLVESIPDTLRPITICTQISLVDRMKRGIFLPLISPFEKRGTVTNHQHRTQTLNGQFRMLPETRSLFEIISGLSVHLHKDLIYESEDELLQKTREMA